MAVDQGITTATRSSIAYELLCDGFKVYTAHDREEAEDARDAHAARNNNDPLSDRYVINPVFREESEGATS